jgi:hypothetical protein
MPFFSWTGPQGGYVISDRFWIYWAFTIPTTLVVFVAYTFWFMGAITRKRRAAVKIKEDVL